jgi:hypothetical protein
VLGRVALWVSIFALLTAPVLWLGLRDNNRSPQSTPEASDAVAVQRSDGPQPSDYVDIHEVPLASPDPPAGPNASIGSFRQDCGTNANGLHNPDNYIAVPGQLSGAHHVHDYLGNQSVNYLTTNESLAASKDTSCRYGDQSTYFWPVVRDATKVGADEGQVGGGKDGNHGRILPMVDVRIEFRGNPQSNVVAMPRFLRLWTGNATAVSSNLQFARSQWTCAGFENRITTEYPLCPNGAVKRIIEYPSCWNGKDLSSNDLRSHTAFPGKDGGCPAGTRAIPKIVIIVTYSVPPGRNFVLDAFPGEHHSPLTDHAAFENVMPDGLMSFIVDCINSDRNC